MAAAATECDWRVAAALAAVLAGACALGGVWLWHRRNEADIRRRKRIPVGDRMRVLLGLLDSVLEIERAAGVPLFAIYGTLLGAIRDGRVICYDYDLDFGVLGADFARVVAAARGFVRAHPQYRLKVYDLPFVRQAVLVHRATGLNADVSTYFPSGPHLKRAVVRLYDYYVKGECRRLRATSVFPLGTARLNGRVVHVPRRPRHVLRCQYGDGYMTPDHTCDNGCAQCTRVRARPT